MYRIGVIFSIILMFAPTNSFAENTFKFHISPDKWKEPRIFHQPLGSLKGEFAKNITIESVNVSELDFEKENLSYSANDAYWYYIAEHQDKKKCKKTNCPIKLYIYNERNIAKIFVLNNVFASSSVIVEWINEKIMYIEPWLKKDRGYYILYDVEQERIIQAEAVYTGGKMFHLFKDK